MKLIVERIQTLPEAMAVLGAAPPEFSRRLSNATLAGWIPLEQCWPVMLALRHEIGDARFLAFYREHTVASMDAPVFSTFVRSLVNLFGTDPGGMSKHLGRAFGMAMRDCGHMRSESQGPGRTLVSITDIPALLAEDDTYALSTEGSLHTLFVLTRKQGHISPDLSELSARTMRFTLEWS